jgi:hypothetical protein
MPLASKGKEKFDMEDCSEFADIVIEEIKKKA